MTGSRRTRRVAMLGKCSTRDEPRMLPSCPDGCVKARGGGRLSLQETQVLRGPRIGQRLGEVR
jgi:hypothetical protein